MGPTLKFRRDGVIAVTGADMQPKLEGQPVPMWESVAVKAGQTLALGPDPRTASGQIAARCRPLPAGS